MDRVKSRAKSRRPVYTSFLWRLSIFRPGFEIPWPMYFKWDSKSRRQIPELYSDLKGQKNAQNKKIPPVQIDVSFEGRQSLFSLLQRSIGVNKYTINQLKTKNSVRVHPANENVATLLTEVLDSHGYKFHSYLGTDKRKQCFILRGLNGFDAPDVVQNHLVRAGLPDSITVLRHTTGFQRANPDKNHNTLYKVIIDTNTNSQTLRNIQSIFGLAIRWEKLKTNGVTQCHNCQSYFHTAACCHHEFRRVKCTNIINRRNSKHNNEGINSRNNGNENKNKSNNGNNAGQQTNGSFASLFDKNAPDSNVNNRQKKKTENSVPVSVSPSYDQQNFMELLSKTLEMMCKSISNQEKILSLLSTSKNE